MMKIKKITKEEQNEWREKHETEIYKRIEEMKNKRQEELERHQQKERRDIIESHLRVDQLEKTVKVLDAVRETYQTQFKAEKMAKEWQVYLACRKLPNPGIPSQMTKYLSSWAETLEFTSIPEASKKTLDCMELIDELEEVIALCTDEDSVKIPTLLWVRELFQKQQRLSLDIATYRLLRDVAINMNRINIPTANYNFQDPYVIISVWLRVQNPIPLKNPRRPPKARIEIKFQEVNQLRVLLPAAVRGHHTTIRAMYLRYDHFSDTCEFYAAPPIPAFYELDLLETCRKNWRLILKYKYARRDKVEPPAPSPDVENPEAHVPEPEDFDSDEEIPIVPYKPLAPTPSEYLSILEEHKYSEARKAFMTEAPSNPDIINLRKYAILGGVYCIDYLHQPPQPHYFATKFDIRLTRLSLPKELAYVDYIAEFIAPPPPAPPDARGRKLPEVIEAEMKAMEEALDKLIFITLSWPTHVIFLDLPIVCVWDETQKLWSKKHIYDLKHNEEEGTLTFRSEVFGIFGLAALRFTNLPYQSWEIVPEADGSVTINITSAILILEFIIKDGMICVSQLQNSPAGKALTEIVDQYYKLHKLKKILKDGGIDIFPEADTHCYIEGTCEKNWPMEKHLYTCMACLCGVFNFAWSRWNVTLDRQNIVMQMREYAPDSPKQKNFSTLLVTPIRACFIKCTEVSPEFTDETTDDKFSSDLYNLMKNTFGMFLCKQVEDFNKLNIYTIMEFLIATRILSFS